MHRNEPILLVEDNDLVRRFTQRLLTRGGYDVTAVATSEQALTCLPGPALLLSDVSIGDELAGPMLASEGRCRDPQLKVLLTTGHAPVVLQEEGILEDLFSIIYKPYSKEQLLAAVRGVLDGLEPLPRESW